MAYREIQRLRRREVELEAEITGLRANGTTANARECYHYALMDSAVDFAVIVIDQVGLITDWNAGAERLLGWSVLEMRGRPLDCIFTAQEWADSCVAKQRQQALDTGYSSDECWHQKRDGSRFWGQSEIMPLRRQDGTHSGFLNILRDRTQQRRREEALQELNTHLQQQVELRLEELNLAQAQLHQAQKMEAIGHLTGGLAHDFNNQLIVITGNLELLQTRLEQARTGDFSRYVVAAQEASKRAAAVTRRLLAFCRRQTPDLKITAIDRLVSGMEELIRRTMGPEIAVEVAAASDLWTTWIDPNQLENALLNLCINARDAMADGGQLTIETTNTWLDEQMARERVLPAGAYVSLCVSDTGTGMTADVLARAFNPFFTTKPSGQGTGLGLSMINAFVSQSGGQVCIYSEPNEGTTICILLPRHLGEAEDAEPPARAAEYRRAKPGETVLVVDDEPTVMEVVSEVLEELGYAVIKAVDGTSALAVLESKARIDLLISDIGLPNGIGGQQIADTGRALRPDMKVLFITGYSEIAVLNQLHLDAATNVLTKPFTMDALASRIKTLLED